jgi:hypothetical protein
VACGGLNFITATVLVADPDFCFRQFVDDDFALKSLPSQYFSADPSVKQLRFSRPILLAPTETESFLPLESPPRQKPAHEVTEPFATC